MSEKELPIHNDKPTDGDADAVGAAPDMSAERKTAASMFAAADRIIQAVSENDSMEFIRQSRQHGGQ